MDGEGRARESRLVILLFMTTASRRIEREARGDVGTDSKRKKSTECYIKPFFQFDLIFCLI